MQVGKIDGGCAKENIASQKVLEKIGVKNKTLEDNVLHYFLTKEEYNRI
jgi:RimJ/RimL family protein N-acetyltransferase